MSTKKETAAVVGVGAACAACCAGPIIGFLAAIGLGTVAGVALFGAIALAVAVIGSFVLLGRRRWQSPGCPSGTAAGPIAVEAPTGQTSR